MRVGHGMGSEDHVLGTEDTTLGWGLCVSVAEVCVGGSVELFMAQKHSVVDGETRHRVPGWFPGAPESGMVTALG